MERERQQAHIVRGQATHFANPRAAYLRAKGAPQAAAIGDNTLTAASLAIRQWPGYRATPLHPLRGLAGAIGVTAIWYKDEATRFGLGSFKALGGAYAVQKLLKRELARRGVAGQATTSDLLAGRYQAVTRDITVTCATDGNHGRSVAWGAQQFGCHCVVYLHANVSRQRVAAIVSHGAEIVRISGNYDDAVRAAAEQSKRNGWFVVSDTSYPGYTNVPRDVMQGYSVMLDEIFQQIPSGESPSHIFVQSGVGGLAAAVCTDFRRRYGDERPYLVVVEPGKAACLFQSARTGGPIAVEGALDTVMAGLSCGEVSLLAWEVLRDAVDHFLTIPDPAAIDVMRLLADPPYQDAPIVAGESGVAGLAGALLAAADRRQSDELAINRDSRILVIGTEGATDPDLYLELVGRPAQQVAMSASSVGSKGRMVERGGHHGESEYEGGSR